MRITIPALIVAAVMSKAPASAFAQTEASFDRTLNVSGTISLDVSTGSGNIAIRGGPNDKVEVHGRIRANSKWLGSTRGAEDAVRALQASPPIEQSGQVIRIGRVGNRELERNVSISYEIVVPMQTTITPHTGSGSQMVEGVNGRLAVDTGSGSLTLRDVKGNLDAATGSGSISATRFEGALRAHTGSGRIQVQGEQSGRWELETGSGSIDLDLPSTASFDLNAHTGSGGIDVGYPMTVQRRLNVNRHDVNGKVGTGNHVLSARTGSGHIHIQ
jgi:DUF4097 and DUF4098 domain-containing protein YvlB